MTATARPPRRDARGEKRRAALIATAVTLPLVVIVALLLGSVSGSSDHGQTSGPLPALTPSAPPNVAAQQQPCTALLEALPVQLNGLAPRVVRPVPATPFVVAWGDPAIVLACGVAKPTDLVAGSDSKLYDAGGDVAGAYYDVTRSGNANVYTTVDRAAFVSITVPGAYQAARYLAILNTAILKAMPKAVCATDSATEPDPDKLCSRRTS